MTEITIADRKIGTGHPCFIVAELGGNAATSEVKAQLLIEAASKAGADAVKCQTISLVPDGGITLECDNEHFQIKSGPWAGQTYYQLYSQTAMRWSWQAFLKHYAESLGMIWFSTPFDFGAVDFLSKLDVPCYKIASFEIVDIPLIERVADKGKPIIISTGMATEAEIAEATRSAQKHYNHDFILLQCTSAYPTPIEEANLNTLTRLKHWAPLVGLSDHTLGTTVPIAAVALGASVIEKHLTLSRADGGPDAGFSLEPHEFADMVKGVRDCEQALGEVRFGPTEAEQSSLQFRRSLFVTEDVREGEGFTRDNVKSIRPTSGLHPRYYNEVLGRKARQDIKRGTPLNWELII